MGRGDRRNSSKMKKNRNRNKKKLRIKNRIKTSK
jgi:hypothetical protein